MTFKPTNPTIVAAADFDATSDAEKLKKAMKGLGTDESKIIKILGRRTNAQRQAIAKAYENNYGKDLASTIKSETTGKFEKVLVSLLTPLPKFYAQQLRGALKGAGTNEKVLNEVLLTLTKEELAEVKEIYKNEYHDTLEHDIKKDTDKDYEDFLLLLAGGERSERSEERAEKYAKKLYSAEESKEAKVYNKIIAKRQFGLLKITFKLFENVSGHNIEESIKRTFSGDYEDALIAAVRRTQGLPEFLAEQLRNAIAGAGTNENTLVRIIVPRSEIDLKSIQDAYSVKYGRSLVDDVKSDTSGDFKKLLVELLE